MKKQISPRMHTDNTDLQIQNGPVELFFDPCKSSVISGEVWDSCVKPMMAISLLIARALP